MPRVQRSSIDAHRTKSPGHRPGSPKATAIDPVRRRRTIAPELLHKSPNSKLEDLFCENPKQHHSVRTYWRAIPVSMIISVATLSNVKESTLLRLVTNTSYFGQSEECGFLRKEYLHTELTLENSRPLPFLLLLPNPPSSHCPLSRNCTEQRRVGEIRCVLDLPSSPR